MQMDITTEYVSYPNIEPEIEANILFILYQRTRHGGHFLGVSEDGIGPEEMSCPAVEMVLVR